MERFYDSSLKTAIQMMLSHKRLPAKVKDGNLPESNKEKANDKIWR